MTPRPDTSPATAPETTVSGAVPLPEAPARPYWLTDAKIDGGVYLGFTRGQWPIQAFSADGSHAAHWASEDPDNRIILGPIPIPDGAPVLRGRKIPATSTLEPVAD